MPLNIIAEDINGESLLYEYDTNPDICPLCICHMKPKKYIANFTNLFFSKERLQIIFRCTNKKCDRFFVATYIKDRDRGYSSRFCLEDLSPKNFPKTEFSKIIKELSPNFVEVYNQAIAAESSNLPQISGMGFRKALEFLIKDFAIDQNPDKEESIKSNFLGTVLKDYIDDPRLKTTAERATWLGNDETHYVKKWIDKDVNDLKLLIRLSVNWIENVLLTNEYSSDMNI